MGGTIRAAFNLAEYMQERGWEVEIISGYRDRDEPFFGSFPAGVPVFDLDDRRKQGLLRRLLRKLPSVLMPNADRAATSFTSGPTSSSCAACAAAPGSSSARARA